MAKAALIVSVLALFVAIGGGAYAALKLKKNAVKTKNIKDGAVTKPKLAADVLPVVPKAYVRFDAPAPSSPVIAAGSSRSRSPPPTSPASI